MPEEKKVIISRDVVFREEMVYKDRKTEATSSQDATRSEALTLASLKLTDDKVLELGGGATDLKDLAGSEETMEETPNLEDYQLATDRARRQTRPPKRLEDYECDATDEEDIYAYYICELPEDASS